MKIFKCFAASLLFVQSALADTPPNIVFILADDLGYGDVGCYNPTSQVPTPNLDRLAKEGMRFTDAHSPATVCTPTRYSLLTGRMCFRTGRSRVFSGVGGPCLIEDGRLTLPQMLKDKGYATAMFGKWHVGMSFFDKEGKRIEKQGLQAVKEIDFSREVGGSPVNYGFDQFYGTACCPTTDWLYAYIDGKRIPVPPVEQVDKSMLPKHPYANDCRGGMVAPPPASHAKQVHSKVRAARYGEEPRQYSAREYAPTCPAMVSQGRDRREMAPSVELRMPDPPA